MSEETSALPPPAFRLPTRRAILFLQLGGPENLDEVPRFLYRLFADPDVIRVKPALLLCTAAVGNEQNQDDPS